MNDRHKDFRERLLAAEQVSPTYKEQYEKEVQAMLERKLTRGQRAGYGASAALGVTFLVIFGTAAVMVPREFPILARIGFAVGAVFGLVWAVFAGWIAGKGALDPKKHPTAMVGMGWGFTVIMITLFMLLSSKLPDPTTGIRMVVNGLVFLVFAAVFMISNRIDQAQLKTREKLLEIEYRLAELAETVAKSEQGQ